MYVYINSDAHATFYDTLAEAQAAWLASRGEGSVAEVLTVHVMVSGQNPPRKRRQRNPDSRSSAARELFRQGVPPMRVAEQTGLTRQAVYSLRAKMRDAGELPS